MRYLKPFISLIFVFLLVFSTAFAAEQSIEEFGLEKIDIPDSYAFCSRTTCDDKFKSILANNNFTFDSWSTQIMAPNNYYLYAIEPETNNYIYVICKKGKIQETITNKDGTKKHKLMDDFNLLSEGDEKKDYLENIQSSLIFQGVDLERTKNLEWSDLGEEYITPYIEYTCDMGSQFLHCYETVFNGNHLKFQFAAPKSFSSAQLSKHREFIKNIGYSEIPDYTEVKNIINENLQIKLAEETHSGENTKILRYSITISIIFVIIFALFMAIRTQYRKRKMGEVPAAKNDIDK